MATNNYDDIPVVADELNLILLIDNSYSMDGGRISQVNNAIPDIKKKLTKIADKESVTLKIRIIAFSDEAVWKVGSVSEGVDIADLVWSDLGVVGGTSTNKAIRAANEVLHTKNLVSDQSNMRILRPVVILITDGYCNQSDHADYLVAIDEMKKRLSGNSGKDKITRIAIGVEDYNRKELEEFASLARQKDTDTKATEPLIFEVDNTDDLGHVIEWVVPTSIVGTINANEEGNDAPIVLPTDPDEDDDIL